MAQEIKKQQLDITRYRDPFAQMRAEMDRLFENFIGRGVFGTPVQSQATQLTPSIDVRENEKEIVIDAELPGMNENDVQIVVREGVVSLKGEKNLRETRKKIPITLSNEATGALNAYSGCPRV
jgi:HSP20 family protein